MIFEQINKYPEPPPTSFYSSTYHDNNKPSAEEWDKICKQALEEVSKILQPGDTVETKLGASCSKTRLTIDHFLTDPSKIYPYKDEPCFIMAKNPKFMSTGATRYALHELDLSTIIKKEIENV